MISIWCFAAYPLALLADPIPIRSIEKVVDKIQLLRAQGIQGNDIGVILDFHGVITEQPSHKLPLTLKGNIKDFFYFLKKEQISYCVATAWHDFKAIIQEGVIPLGLVDLLEVDPKCSPKLQRFDLGQDGAVFLVGYENGKLTALKGIKALRSGDPYYRQKAFALEKIYPGRIFKYLIIVEDDEDNLKKFENDFLSTIYAGHKDFKELFIFHLTEHKSY